MLNQFPSDRLGHPVAPLDVVMPARRGPAAPCAPGQGDGTGYMHAVFHPASHFWPLQLIETAIFGGVAVALIGFAAWWTLRKIV